MQTITIDDIAESHNYLRALNAELLAALIQMEHWTSCLAKQLSAADASKIRLHRDIGKARAVIAKAKELEL